MHGVCNQQRAATALLVGRMLSYMLHRSCRKSYRIVLIVVQQLSRVYRKPSASKTHMQVMVRYDMMLASSKDCTVLHTPAIASLAVLLLYSAAALWVMLEPLT